jgi:MFS family permease
MQATKPTLLRWDRVQKTSNLEVGSLFAIAGLSVLSASLLGPVLPLYLASINISPETIGLMFSAAMVGAIIGETASGWLAERFGVWVPLSSGALASAVAVFSFVLTRDVAAIFAIMFCWGLVRTAQYGPTRGFIGLRVPEARRTTFMALFTVVMTLTRSLGALPSGFIVDNWSYESAFFVSAGIAGLAAVVVATQR